VVGQCGEDGWAVWERWLGSVGGEDGWADLAVRAEPLAVGHLGQGRLALDGEGAAYVEAAQMIDAITLVT
jgi:hypothetical protein